VTAGDKSGGDSSGGDSPGGEAVARLAARAQTWWLQFPVPLRDLARIRLIAMVGAGGVLYLTPMVFHQEAFSASSVTEGLALAALAGTGGRLLSGVLLDRGLSCSLPVLLACLSAMLGDTLLFQAEGFGGFVGGQLLLGIAMGLYWPAIELAVPLGCPPIPSARGFALVRSADALGIVSGALIGALLAALGRLRGIYLIDIACLVTVIVLLWRRPLPKTRRRREREGPSTLRSWLPPLLPILAVTVLATALPALMQSALPLDLVRGGLQRSPLPESLGALTIGLQLALLMLIQWPVGQALARQPVGAGLTLSLASFAVGCSLLAASAFSSHGMVLMLLAQLPLALGEAAFLPTATEAVVELSPQRHQGLAMALFSQCFAISAFTAPLLAGQLLDQQRHGVGLWLGMAALCVAGLPLVGQVERFQRRNLLQVLSSGGGDLEGEGGRQILYRFDTTSDAKGESGGAPQTAGSKANGTQPGDQDQDSQRS
jgi:MFS family permease